MLKRYISLCLLIILSFYLLGCQEEASHDIEKFVSIEINPKIDLILNQDDKITHVYLRNEDARIVYSDTSFLGKDIYDAIDLVIDEAVETGFIDLYSTSNVIFIYADDIGHDQDEHQHVLTKHIEKYLKTHAIGAICLNQLDYTNGIETIKNTYDVENEKARLMYALHEISAQNTYETLKKLSSHQLLEKLKVSYDEKNNDFLEEQDSYKTVKKTFESFFLSSVQAYRMKALKKDLVQPDLTDIKMRIASDFEEEMSKINERHELTKAFVTAKDTQTIHQAMVGQYVFNTSDFELTHFVNYHTIILYSDGTYQERYSWTSKETPMTASSEMTGIWSYENRRIILTFNHFDKVYEVIPGLLVLHETDGNRLTFSKVSNSD